MTVPGRLPLPPCRAVPPIITAHIASISIFKPAFASALFSRAVTITPATEESSPMRAKADTRYFHIFTPRRFSASGLLPRDMT